MIISDKVRARSETVYAGIDTGTSLVGLKSYHHFSGRLPYRYVVGRSVLAATFTVHSAVHEICSVDTQEN